MTGTDWLGGRSLSTNNALQWRLSKQTPKVQVSSWFLSSKCLSFRNCMFVYPQWGQRKYLSLPLCYFMFCWLVCTDFNWIYGSYSCYFLVLRDGGQPLQWSKFWWVYKICSTSQIPMIQHKQMVISSICRCSTWFWRLFARVSSSWHFYFWHSTLYLDYSLLILILRRFQLPYVNHICLMHSNK